MKWRVSSVQIYPLSSLHIFIIVSSNPLHASELYSSLIHAKRSLKLILPSDQHVISPLRPASIRPLSIIQVENRQITRDQLGERDQRVLQVRSPLNIPPSAADILTCVSSIRAGLNGIALGPLGYDVELVHQAIKGMGFV